MIGRPEEQLPRVAMPTADPFLGFTLSDKEFRLFQDLVKASTGITLSEHKRNLVSSRLSKRLRVLGLPSFQAYHDYLIAEPAEMENFVNAITTNKTDFYREKHHFDFLERDIVPAWKTRAARIGERRLRIWSAGCSSGEEPYTIAITLREAMDSCQGWDVRILASDIDTAILERATQAIYQEERVADIPRPLMERHFLKGKGAHTGSVQVVREARDLVTFRQINLLEDQWPIRTVFDVIFCRNVIIYFDKPTQRRLMEHFATHLKDDGYLFIGHSETLHGLSDQFTVLGNTVYQKRSGR